jgi:hypothetical protein
MSCSKDKIPFIVADFNPFTNYALSSDTLLMQMDLSDVISNGIIIPSKNSSKDLKYFKISFTIKNTSDNPKIFFYKIYYQNESYKYQEYLDRSVKKVFNKQSSNNFYGSWENTAEEFHKTELIPADNNFHKITDSIRIVGNPREEQKYFGSETINTILTSSEINNTMERIRSSEEWLKQIQDKAIKNNLALDEQLRLDAIWILNNDRTGGQVNNRWKRNPRTGIYSFMLVVTDENQMNKIPIFIKNIGLMDTVEMNFINPYYYFHSGSKKPNDVYVEQSNKILKTKALLDVSKGIYVDPFKFGESVENSANFNELCGTSDKLFNEAHYEQFFHNINKNFKLKNIPVVYDVVNDNYTSELYNANKSKYESSGLLEDYFAITKDPGKTVEVDKKMEAIVIYNPGNKTGDQPVKENVGVNTRIGFTYGKYCAKIKFPTLLSSDNVWNGVTCAFWLLYQDAAEWNNRCECIGSGYIPKGEIGKSEIRTPYNTYTEIDIEIVKTSKYWPGTSYTTSNFPKEDPSINDNLIVACTNWDLACREPSNFHTGVKSVDYNGTSFALHRWDDWYKALTSKYSDHQNNIVGDIIYYEIDWQPDRIIWRIGKSKNNMKIIGYMDSTVTKIPDNQMIAVITQEFHDATWWPLTPWKQNFIPYPKNDISGYIYEIEIE